MSNLRFRQVHLDFHTSGDIPDIGQEFNAQEWQKTLIAGHVNSITCFATCHHGWSYYDTKIGQRHPGLSFDLLRAQFEACKKIDVNVPIYLTAGVNNWASHAHPEWREVGHDGRYIGWTQEVTRPGFHCMCFNTPYLDFLCEQIREVVRLFPNCDGIFLDIITQRPCCCRWCMDAMRELDLDASHEPDRLRHAQLVMGKYYRATTAAVRAFDPAMKVFHNSGHVGKGDRELINHVSHLELESLPTGGWGYDHFPLSAKYCSQLGKPFLGMTGKFHTSWGEFGGYKHPNALRYECAAMIANGARCSVGDQLHPNGKLDPSTYALIGQAYKEVAIKEPWCTGAVAVADIGLLSCEAVNGTESRNVDADTGAGRILLESHILFDVLDAEMPFDGYQAILLPDWIKVSPGLKSRIDDYLGRGGKLIVTGDSGVDDEAKSFLWDIGAEFAGKSEFQPDYIAPAESIRPTFCNSPMVMYLGSNRLRVGEGRSLGKVHEPYFNRTFRHFCSHQHTPNRPEPSPYDCGVIRGNILYLAHPVFTIYRGYGAVVYREYVVNAIRALLGQGQTVQTSLPSTARINLMHQEFERRYVLHLLYAPTIARGGAIQMPGETGRPTQTIEVIEDLLLLHDVRVSLKLDHAVRRVTLQPEGIRLPLSHRAGRAEVNLDSICCHQMVVLEY
jgi:hypothetical protein